MRLDSNFVTASTHPGYYRWVWGPYVIARYHKGEFYAYVSDEQGASRHVKPPPDEVPCQGCGSAHCNGTHKAWKTFEAAEDACIEHSLNLPW